MRFGMFVDAACDLAPEFIAANPVYVLPIPIRVGDRELIDNRDPEVTGKFFDRVLRAGLTDVESKPYSEAELERLFLDKLALEFDYVICLVINGSRSPIFERTQKASFHILTKYRPARAAAGVAGPFAMRVFDSRNMFAAQGVQIQELARLIRADTPVTRIFKRMDEIIPQTYGYMVPADLGYLYKRASKRGDRSVGFLGYTLGSALDIKPVVRCFHGDTGPVAKVRHFDAACERVFANVRRQIERGLVAPFVNVSYGDDRAALLQLPGYLAMARAAQARGVEVQWSHLSMSAGVNVGPGALTVGIVAQPHEFE
jgi:DegV family protein with EDD domain